MVRRKSLLRRSWETIRAQFLVGVFVAVPLAVTVLILVWVFNRVDDILRPVVTLIAGRSLPGVGFVATVLLIYLAGVVGSSIVGKRMLVFSDSFMDRVPVVRTIYATIKQVLEGFSNAKATGFMQVVLIEYPRKGIMSIAFVTNEFSDASGAKFLNVFVPTSPNPTSGFLRIMKSEEVTRVGLTVDEAIKMLVSFGRVTPDNAATRLGEKEAQPPE